MKKNKQLNLVMPDNSTIQDALDSVRHSSVTPADYTFDDLKQVWYLSMQVGAVIYQAVNDNVIDKSTEQTQLMVKEVMQALYDNVNTKGSLQDICTNRMLLLGVIAEVLNLETLK